MNVRFAGKSVIVTGAASGIGREAACLFAREGAQVLAIDMSDRVADLAAEQSGIRSLCADAGSEEDVERVVAEAVALHGGLDILFANAGISGGNHGLFEHRVQDFMELLRVNLIGPYLALKHGAPPMIERGGGAIICTASVAGLRAGAGGLPYSASKAGVISLVETAAQQLTGSGVRINAVCPGLIRTPMTRDLYERSDAEGAEPFVTRLMPLQRSGEPIEIAGAVAFLASDEASYVTGHALVVDGGYASSHPFSRPRKLGEAITP